MRLLKGIFAFAVLCLGTCIQIALLRNGIFPNPLILISCIVGALVALMYQIGTLRKFSSSLAVLLLAQILILAFALRILFVSNGMALAGYDAYNEYVSLILTVDENRWNPDVVGTFSSSYPLLYISGASWAHLVGTDLVTVAKWLPISIFPMAIFMVFLLARARYGVLPAILATYGLGFLYISLFFHSALQRETIALPFFLMTIWLTGHPRKTEKRDLRFIGLAIVSAIVCVLSHHLTAFMLLVFLLILLATQAWKDRRPSNIGIVSIGKKLESASSHYVLLFIVMVFGYWICLRYTPLEFLTSLVTDASIVRPGTGAIIPDTFRYTLLFYGEVAFACIFVAISISAVFHRGKERTPLDLALLIFAGLAGVVMILTLEGRLMENEGFGLGSRFETFVYAGLFILAGCAATQKLADRSARISMRHVVIIAIVAFAILSVIRISPSLYSSEDFEDEVRLLVSDSEISAAIWLGLPADSGLHIDDPAMIPPLSLTEIGHFGFGLEDRATEYSLRSFARDSGVGLETSISDKIYDSGKAWIDLEL